jgi:hypothetical protein
MRGSVEGSGEREDHHAKRGLPRNNKRQCVMRDVQTYPHPQPHTFNLPFDRVEVRRDRRYQVLVVCSHTYSTLTLLSPVTLSLQIKD